VLGRSEGRVRRCPAHSCTSCRSNTRRSSWLAQAARIAAISSTSSTRVAPLGARRPVLGCAKTQPDHRSRPAKHGFRAGASVANIRLSTGAVFRNVTRPIRFALGKQRRPGLSLSRIPLVHPVDESGITRSDESTSRRFARIFRSLTGRRGRPTLSRHSCLRINHREGDMCESCGVAEKDGFDIGGRTLSRRLLLAGAGVGLVGATLLGAGNQSPAHGATLQNGAWCNPALGYFPNGGHFGAPRNGGSHTGQDVTNSSGTAVYAAAAGTVIRRQWGGGLPYRT